jgi:hypothetical protein
MADRTNGASALGSSAAQAGYNWHFGRAVTGLKFDFSSADIKGSNSVVFNSSPTTNVTQTRDDSVKYLGTARSQPAHTATLGGTGC